MAILTQIRPVSLREQVVDQVRAAIIEGRLKPGDHVAEAALTAQLGVSRTPVREALILLEREGLIVAEPNRGAFVRSFTAADVREVFSMRTALENLAAERLVERLGSDDYARLRDLTARERDAIARGDVNTVRTVDMAFHRFLVTRAEHALLLKKWTEIVAQIAAVLYIRGERLPNFDESQAITDHEAIVEALEAHDLRRLRALNREINARVAEECARAIEMA